MKIKYQLFFYFLVIVSIFLIVGFFNNIIKENIAHANEEIMTAQSIKTSANGYEAGAKALQTGVFLYVYGNKELGRQFMNEGLKKMAQSRNDLKGLLAGSEMQAYLSEIERSEQKVIEKSNNIVIVADGSPGQMSLTIIETNLKALDERLTTFDLEISTLIKATGVNMEKAALEIQSQSENTMKLIYVGLFGSFLQSLILALIFSERLTKALKSIEEVVNKVSNGDIYEKLEVYSKDEIGELAESIKRIVNAYKIVEVLDKEK